jgi:hypothetical protein
MVEVYHRLNTAYVGKFIINRVYTYHKKKEIDSFSKKINGKHYGEHYHNVPFGTG